MSLKYYVTSAVMRFREFGALPVFLYSKEILLTSDHSPWLQTSINLSYFQVKDLIEIYLLHKSVRAYYSQKLRKHF